MEANAARRLSTRPRVSPGTRAWIFGAFLLLLGGFAVYVRVAHPPFHPQLVLFFYSIPANSAISVFSHEVALIDYGAHQPILLSAVVAAIGTMAAGYLDWHIFVPLFSWEKICVYRRNRVAAFCLEKFDKAPFAILMLTGFTPVPFFPFKFMAFAQRYPLWKYLSALLIARFPRYLILAWFGSVAKIPPWVLIVAFVVFFGAVVAGKAVDWVRSRRKKDAPVEACTDWEVAARVRTGLGVSTGAGPETPSKAGALSETGKARNTTDMGEHET